jgi:TRAP transporter TAXI family solute receptor
MMKFLKWTVAVAALTCAAAAAQAQQVRVIASNPQGSIFYAASVAMGKLLDEKLKIQVRVQPMAGSSTYIPLIDRGEVDFGLTNVDDARSSYKGEGNFKRASSNLRLTAIAFPLTLGILVLNDSPIKTVQDLKGKTLPWGYNAQTTGRVLQEAVLASAGLTMKDVKTVPTQSLFSGVDLLGEGKVDAAVISVGTGQAQQANVNMSSHGGIRFLKLDPSPEAVARMRKILPARSFLVEPAAHAVGIIGPTTVMAYNVFFSTGAATPDDLVYNVVKAMHEAKDDLVKNQPVFKQFDPKRMTEEIGVPWHPGALKFYKEIGQWPPAE